MRRKRLIIAGILLLVVGGGIFAWLRAPVAPDWTLTLSDGSVLKLVQVTYATNHVFHFHDKYPMLNPLGRWIPPAWRTNLGFRMTTAGAPPPARLGLWFQSISGPSATNRANLPGGRANDPSIAVEITDDAGVTLKERLVSLRTVGSYANGAYFNLILGHFPRHDRTLHLRFFENQTNSVPLAEWNIPNPAPQPASGWVAEKLPARRTTNDLELTLLEFKKIPPPDHFMTQASTAVQFQYRLNANGSPAAHWTVIDAILYNDSGHTNLLRRYRTTGPYTAPQIGIPLWASDGVWKLQLAVAQVSGFGPENSWSTGNMPLPAPGQRTNVSLPPDAPKLAQGVSITLARYAMPSNDISFYAQASAPVWISVPHLADDQGRNANPFGYSVEYGMDNLNYVNPLWYWFPPVARFNSHEASLREGAVSFNATFGISPIYIFEFTVKPEAAESTSR